MKKVLLLVICCLLLLLLGPPFLVAAVIATHPWLGSAVLQSKPLGTDAIVVTSVPNAEGLSLTGQLVPVDQWEVMQATAAESSCGVTAQDLAAIGKVESEWGANQATNATGHFGYGQWDAATWAAFGAGNPSDFHDAIPAIERTLCGKGYASNRVAALNSYGGCLTPNCLGVINYSGAIAITTEHITSADLIANGDVIGAARRFLGVPYQWGGTTSAALDCSGLVYLTYKELGITTIGGHPFPRTAALQYAATPRVSQAELLPGDLVFFSNTDGPGITHVGIYVGGGQMEDAPTEGTKVRIEPVFSGFFGQHYAGAGRVMR